MGHTSFYCFCHALAQMVLLSYYQFVTFLPSFFLPFYLGISDQDLAFISFGYEHLPVEDPMFLNADSEVSDQTGCPG